MIQLDFFREEDYIIIQNEVERLKKSNDRMRKALFARHGKLANDYIDLEKRLAIIEKNICLGNL